MNVRRGFRRLAYVSAALYWLVAIVVSGGSALSAYQSAVEARSYDAIAASVADQEEASKPWDAYWKTYVVRLPDGRRVTLKAESQEAAEHGATEWGQTHPKARPLRSALLAGAAALLWAAAGFAVLWAALKAGSWVVGGFSNNVDPKLDRNA